jgi:quinolinate synthase
LADKILSTGGMCDFARTDGHTEFIIATESGILHTLKKQNPQKNFYTMQNDITCPNMKKTTLALVAGALEGISGMKVSVDPVIAQKAKAALVRMLEMSKK